MAWTNSWSSQSAPCATCASCPEFVREGGPSFNAEDPRSLNSLLDSMGSWRLTRYSTGAVDYSGDWVAEIEPTEAHMAGS